MNLLCLVDLILGQHQHCIRHCPCRDCQKERRLAVRRAGVGYGFPELRGRCDTCHTPIGWWRLSGLCDPCSFRADHGGGPTTHHDPTCLCPRGESSSQQEGTAVQPQMDAAKLAPPQAWRDHNGLVWVLTDGKFHLPGWANGITEDQWREGGPDGYPAERLLTRAEWEELHALEEQARYSGVLAALDRCVHGRHKADNCWTCPDGQSTGNLFLQPGTRVGTTLYGSPITAPDHDKRGYQPHWVPEGERYV